MDGVPVFDSAAEAVKTIPEINCGVTYVPAGAVKRAAMDAMDAGLKFLVLTADGVPTHDQAVSHPGYYTTPPGGFDDRSSRGRRSASTIETTTPTITPVIRARPTASIVVRPSAGTSPPHTPPATPPEVPPAR